jgi:formamidase
MPQEHVVSIDPSKPLVEESETGQNRWHEAIEPVVEVDSGNTVVYETRDAFEEQPSPGVGLRGPGQANLLPRVARRARREVG